MKATLPADLWIPPVLKFYEEFAYADFYNFIIKLDNKFSYDWVAQYTPTTRIENINNILKEIENSENVSELFNSDVFEIDVANLIQILNGDIYGRRYARYILYKLDFLYSSKDEKFSIPKTISVEHILPQNPKDDSQWIKDYPEGVRIGLTDKIGNLVLISRRKNSSQGRVDFELKKKNYFENNIELFRNSVRVLTQNSKWSPKELNLNQIDVIAKIENHYRQ